MENGQNLHLPDWLRFLMLFIDRCGFPILAFLIMTYMCFVTVNQNTKAIVELKYSDDKKAEALRELVSTLRENFRHR